MCVAVHGPLLLSDPLLPTDNKGLLRRTGTHDPVLVGLSVAHLSRPRTSLPGKPSFPLGKLGTPLSEARLSYPECVRHRGSGDSGKGREGPAVQDELGSAPRRGSSWPGCLPRTHSLCCFIGCRPICMNLDSLWEALYTSSGGGVRSPSALGEGQGGRSNLAQLG